VLIRTRTSKSIRIKPKEKIKEERGSIRIIGLLSRPPGITLGTTLKMKLSQVAGSGLLACSALPCPSKSDHAITRNRKQE